MISNNTPAETKCDANRYKIDLSTVSTEIKADSINTNPEMASNFLSEYFLSPRMAL